MLTSFEYLLKISMCNLDMECDTNLFYYLLLLFFWVVGGGGGGYSNDNLNLISRLWIRKELYLLFLTRKMETLFCLFVSKREAM